MIMNERILELLKNPEILEVQDLKTIEKEIHTKPYFQGLRALFLLGTHRFTPENYHRELSKTAAYTTDKKILYQLINGKKMEEFSEEKSIENTIEEPENQQIFVSEKIEEKGEQEIKTEDKTSETIVENSVPQYGFITTSSVPKKELKSSLITKSEPEFPKKDEEIERKILDENIQEAEAEEIEQVSDKIEEAPKEIEKIEPKDEEIEQVEPEKIINEDEIKTQKEEIENPSQISFHGLQEFLPEVKIEPKKSEILTVAPEKPSTNKHDEEMKRLIAEVEAKMKSKKTSQTAKEKPIEKEENHDNTEISFAETQSFEPEKTEEKPLEIVVEEVPQKKAEELEKVEKKVVEEKTENVSAEWKPMSFKNSIPDALITKKQEEKVEIPAEKSIEKEEKTVKITSEKQEEIPVMNVSFFAPKIENIEEKSEEKTEEIEEEETKSNIPTFINTWQNWLKIDRNEPKTEEKPEISKEEIKSKVIETFIEKEPKISKLKEDSDFVVKEKSDNISHLMTETLAKLYTEQKLYSKAIKAYEVLSQKHPEKADYFAEKIEEIKLLRQNK